MALVLAALLVAEPVALDRPALLLVCGLAGLAVVCGVSLIWSLSPDSTWTYTNRTLVYLAFALAGLLLGVRITRRARRSRPRRCSGSSSAGRCSQSACRRSTPTTAGLRGFAHRSTTGTSSRCSAPSRVGIALWLAVVRRRLEGVVLLYGLVVTLLLTYSRFGVLLACRVAVVWILVDTRRVESLVVVALGGGAASPSSASRSRSPGSRTTASRATVRAHDGSSSRSSCSPAPRSSQPSRGLLAQSLGRRRDPRAARARRGDRGASSSRVAGLAVAVVFAGRIWHEFTNPVYSQVRTRRVASPPRTRATAGAGGRRHGTRSRAHPIGGTGAGTFGLTIGCCGASPSSSTSRTTCRCSS